MLSSRTFWVGVIVGAGTVIVVQRAKARRA